MQGVSILLVDDQPENLLSLRAILDDESLELVMARSGREALRQLLERDFAVILLDVQMPGMDGFETAAMIRERERSRHTPIIFLTALGRSQWHIFKGYEVGAVDYLVKPLVPEILKSKVAVFVDLFRMSEEVKRQKARLEEANRRLEEEIVERRRAEEETLRLNRELEIKVSELTVVNHELESFSYSVSHDLRAPLRGIDGFSQMLLKKYSSCLDEKGRDYLNRVRDNAQRMGQLIDDLLKLSRITRVEMEKADVDLSLVARSIAQELKRRGPNRQVEFIVEEGARAVGDARLLKTAMENLLGNAWKYTARREKARVEFGAMKKDGEQVFFVRDDGAGFDMAYAHKLFDAFQRLHSDEQFEGTGIGLSIVQRIIHRHGGRVWAEGAIDQGATFYFTL
jgi:hypothetical protein